MPRSFLAMFVAIGVALCGATGPVLAQPRPAEATSGIPTLPDVESWRVGVYGDGMAEGLLGGLTDAFAGEPRIRLPRKHRAIAGLFRSDAEEDAKAIETEIAREPPQIAILMFAIADRVPIRLPNGRRAAVGSEEWRTEYGRRMDRLMRVFRSRNIAVYWVGLPIMRRQDFAEDAQMMDGVMRERALVNGVRYIDVLTSFAGADGAYNSSGPDVTGKNRLLREQDGVHFTPAGYRKLAHFVERELRRDMAQARTERAIPLAGSEEEQRRVRPQTASASAQPAGDGRSGVSAGPVRLGTLPQSVDTGTAGDVRAENSRVTIKATDAQGREDVATIDILRPAIPASVVSLLTRRESTERATLVGDPIMTEILNGVTVVSSITPSGDGPAGDRRRQSTVNSLYFQVLVKGERLPPRSGRSDDLPWPRQEVLPPQPPTPAVIKSPDPTPSAATTNPKAAPRPRSAPMRVAPPPSPPQSWWPPG